MKQELKDSKKNSYKKKRNTESIFTVILLI